MDEILKNYEDYEKYLGIANHELPKTSDEIVNTRKFQMDTEPKIK